MNVLLVVAHPDDEVLGVGGTAARHVAAGDNVVAYIAADCMSARVGGEPRLPDAALEAAKVIGLTLRFGGFGGMTLATLRDTVRNRAVEDAVRELRPEVVYTHHLGDPNSDHRAMAAATMIATRPICDGAPARVLCFETPSSTEWGWESRFEPNVFIDVTATIGCKLNAMACYDAELRQPPHPRSLESLRDRAAYWGQIAGVRYAEPFALMREIVR